MASRDLMCLNLSSMSNAPSADLRVLNDSSMNRFASTVDRNTDVATDLLSPSGAG